MRCERVLVSLAVLALVGGPAFADAILGPNDLILAIDGDGIVSSSSYPAAEAPANILDGNPATKYLNRGGAGSGFIVTPSAPMMVQSFVITTANDAVNRDPTSWELYGTNDAVVSADNSAGIAETWTLVASGTLELPAERLTVGPVVSFMSFDVYKSFKMVFPTNKGDSLFQIADIAMYMLPDAQGANILLPTDPIKAIESGWQSRYPANEAPANAIDGNPATKYLNFGETKSGFIVTPALGASILDSFQITTANDAVERDPVIWMVYGTNDAIVTPMNGDGKAENWTLICGGTMALPAERLTAGPVYVIANQAEAYTSYKMVFETVKNEAAANSMQIAEVQFYGTPYVAPVQQ
ncbi:MAG: discoidin domain-containing protein [Planctomycetes bacterium]|nr:discoidin domain-containing protein [Planctomycetota bacterium]